MSLANIYKTLCDGLGLTPVNGSYVQALGNYYGVVDAPGKRYEDEVLVAAMANGSGTIGSRIESPDTTNYIECLDTSIDVYSNDGISMSSQGDLIYSGNSAVSFTSLGGVYFNAEGGFVFTDNTTGFIQFNVNLPTTDIGLPTGQLYTQTATELGGAGTQKVICIK